VQEYNQILEESTLFFKNDLSAGHEGMKMHIADIYLEELYRITEGQISSATLNLLLEPFLSLMTRSPEFKTTLKRVQTCVFEDLLSKWSPYNQDMEDEEEEPKKFSSLDLNSLSSRILALASSPETSEGNRNRLYGLRKLVLQAHRNAIELGSNGNDVMDEIEEIEDQPPSKKQKTETQTQNSEQTLREDYMKLESVQDQLEKLNEEAADEILKIEKRFNLQRAPFYKERNTVIQKIPGFWKKTFQNHEFLCDCLTENDLKIFEYVTEVNVDHSDDTKGGFKISFKFKSNPFFKNDIIFKEFLWNDE